MLERLNRGWIPVLIIAQAAGLAIWWTWFNQLAFGTTYLLCSSNNLIKIIQLTCSLPFINQYSVEAQGPVFLQLLIHLIYFYKFIFEHFF